MKGDIPAFEKRDNLKRKNKDLVTLDVKVSQRHKQKNGDTNDLYFLSKKVHLGESWTLMTKH